MGRRTAGALVVVLALLGSSGCGDDASGSSSSAPPSESSTAPSETSTTSAEPTPSAATSSSTGGAAAGDTYADVAPATGPQLSSELATVNLPADWTVDEGDEDIALGPTTEYVAQLIQTTSGPDTDLGALTDQVIEFRGLDPVQRLDDIVLAGQPAFHVSGTDEVFDDPTDIFGFSTGGQTIEVKVATPPGLPQAEREALLATILASFELTGS